MTEGVDAPKPGLDCVGWETYPCPTKSFLPKPARGKNPKRCLECRLKQQGYQMKKYRMKTELATKPEPKGITYDQKKFPGRAELQSLARRAGLLKENK
jgi:hypothetical protein